VSGDGERRIVVGVDGSEASIRALRWAVTQAVFSGSVVEAIICWEITPYLGMAGWVPDEQLFPGNLAEQVLAEAIGQAVGDERPVEIRSRTEQGGPARVLVEASADADQLVVGNRGHGSLAGALLGSVGFACAHSAKCPVTIIHTTTRT